MDRGLIMRRILAGVAVVSSILVYQNCAPTSDSSANNSSSSYTSGLPFAYKAQIDTLSYMSCSNNTNASNASQRAYYSFRASAYDPSTGGLTLTQPFMAATAYYTTQNRALAFSDSDLNVGTLLNLSIRSRGDAQSIWQTDGINLGFEIDTFLPQLDGPEVAGVLASTGTPGTPYYKSLVNYFPGDGTQRLMEASLRFYEQPENVSQMTRGNLSGAGQNPAYLVVGFTDSSDPANTSLRVPPPTVEGQTVPASRAYGVGYMVNFSLPNGYTSGDGRVISPSAGLSEIDMSTGQPQGSNWDCRTDFQFEIVRPEDIAAGFVVCNMSADSYTGTSQIAALSAIRRVLRVEDWYVDVTNHCVVPKGTGDQCYGQLAAGQYVVYGGSSCADTATTLCPHFVSVCIRR